MNGKGWMDASMDGLDVWLSAHSNRDAGFRTYPSGYQPQGPQVVRGLRAWQNRVGVFLHNSRHVQVDGAALHDNVVALDFDRVEFCGLRDATAGVTRCRAATHYGVRFSTNYWGSDGSGDGDDVRNGKGGNRVDGLAFAFPASVDGGCVRAVSVNTHEDKGFLTRGTRSRGSRSPAAPAARPPG